MKICKIIFRKNFFFFFFFLIIIILDNFDNFYYHRKWIIEIGVPFLEYYILFTTENFYSNSKREKKNSVMESWENYRCWQNLINFDRLIACFAIRGAFKARKFRRMEHGCRDLSRLIRRGKQFYRASREP